MDNVYDSEYITFQDIYSYIERQGNSKLIGAAKHLIVSGFILLPSIFTRYFGEQKQFMSFVDCGSQILSDIATGVSLAGVGIPAIVGDVLKDLFRKKSDYQEALIKMQTIYHMCFYASFFEAVKETLAIEGFDNIFIEIINCKNTKQKVPLDLDDDELYISFNSTEDIKQGYNVLTEKFRKSLFSFDDMQMLVKETEEQLDYIMERIKQLPDIATIKYTQQIAALVIKYPQFQSWLSLKFQTEIKNQFDDLPNTIAEHVSKELITDLEKRQALRKELFSRSKEKFFYLFEDEQCNVEDVFTLSNYSFIGLCGDGLKEKVNNIHEIMDVVKKQRYLLISGPYGSGKTTLIKKIYLEYRRKSQEVYAFEAKDLVNIASNEIEFESFFNCVCNEESIIIIDSLDDLNIPNSNGAEKSLLEYFVINMFQLLKRNKSISFILASREYAYIYDDSEESVGEKIFLYDLEEHTKK